MSGKPNHQPAPQRDTQSKGDTSVSRHQKREPRLPHERDESSDSHTGTEDERIKQAAKDVENGQEDTGRAPVVSKLQREHFPAKGTKKAKAAP